MGSTLMVTILDDIHLRSIAATFREESSLHVATLRDPESAL